MELVRMELAGKDYVILGRTEHEQLTKLANTAQIAEMLLPDGEGNYPAVAYVRASLAEKITRDRRKAKLSHEDLARMARTDIRAVRRVETGQGVPSFWTVKAIDEVLKRYEGRI